MRHTVREYCTERRGHFSVSDFAFVSSRGGVQGSRNEGVGNLSDGDLATLHHDLVKSNLIYIDVAFESPSVHNERLAIFVYQLGYVVLMRTQKRA